MFRGNQSREGLTLTDVNEGFASILIPICKKKKKNPVLELSIQYY